MFKRIANWLAAAVGSVATKYALRASVALPFLLAAGFGIAGLTVFLIDHFGSRDAYLLLAAGFAICGLLAMLIVRWREANEEEQPAAPATASVAPLVTAATKAVSAGMGEKAPERQSAWASLSGWPLYLAALGLILFISQDRTGERRYR